MYPDSISGDIVDLNLNNDIFSVISYDDFVTYGTLQKAKEAGKMRSEGKEYVFQDGDIVLFRFNV